MYCLVCGAQIDDEAVSCPKCGSAVKISPPRLNEVKSSIKQEDMKSEICPACGYVYDAGMMFCPRCGKSQSLYSKDRLNNGQTDINRFDKYPATLLRDPERDFEMRADMGGSRYDFEKYPKHAPSRRRSFVGLLIVAAVVIAAAAAAVYFFM